jgi:hypothetical protein
MLAWNWQDFDNVVRGPWVASMNDPGWREREGARMSGQRQLYFPIAG